MILFFYTIFQIITLEVVFRIAKKVINKKDTANKFIINLRLLDITVLLSYIGSAIAIFQNNPSGVLTFSDVLLLSFSVFYSFFVGLRRIHDINKRYKNEQTN